MLLFAVLEQFSSWWESQALARQVFLAIAILASLATVLMLILSLIGADHHDGLDADGSFFSVKPITGFFLGFGWAGAIALSEGGSVLVGTLAGIATGGLMMAATYGLFRMLLRLKTDGTVRFADAVGAIGTVYLTIPPAGQTGGQINVTFGNRNETVAALQKGDAAIPAGEKVRVTGLVDRATLIVERAL
jgi:hypothetical protein